jgi:hypothetical protein
MDYVVKAFSTWFMGFFPLTEIYIAVPAGMATGLDDVSVIIWAVLGNILPIAIIHYGYDGFIRTSRFGQWLESHVGDTTKARINRYGMGVVLVMTPWVGVWLMAVTAKLANMRIHRFAIAAIVSIMCYAVAITLLIRTGASMFG